MKRSSRAKKHRIYYCSRSCNQSYGRDSAEKLVKNDFNSSKEIIRSLLFQNGFTATRLVSVNKVSKDIIPIKV